MAPLVSPDEGETLYVCNRFNNDISVIDLASWKECAENSGFGASRSVDMTQRWQIFVGGQSFAVRSRKRKLCICIGQRG